MVYKRISPNPNNKDVTMDCHISGVKEPLRDAMIVLPGGGYKNICADREGEPVALAFLARGFNAFVLNYTVEPIENPYMPMADVSFAIAYIREHAAELGINKERVFLTGFSAGAHLAATLGSLWNDETLCEKTSLDNEINRPTGIVLCYPVISCYLQNEERVFRALLGEKFNNKEYKDKFSAEKIITENSVPAFLVHTLTDETVPVENSFVFANEMAKNNLLCEVHIYPKGPHGMALANSDTNLGRNDLTDESYARWVDDACTFLKRIV